MLQLSIERVTGGKGGSSAPARLLRYPGYRTGGHRLAVALMAAGAGVLHLAVGLQHFRGFRIGAYDLVIFDQGMRGYAGLGLPTSPLKAVHSEMGAGFSLLGDHWSPVLALLTPLYWIWDDPRMLLFAQAALFALGVPVVWRFTRRALGVGPAYLVAAAFAMAWQLQQASAVGFHEVAFAVPLLVLMIERAQVGRVGQAAFAAGALLFVKEDLGLVVALFGVLLVLRGWRRTGLGLAAAGLLAPLVTLLLLIPAFGGRAGYRWHYDALGDDVPSALAFVARHPLDTLQLAFVPDVKWQTLLWNLLPLAAMCLLSPLVLLALPLLAERMLSSQPNWWWTDDHYDAYLVGILVLAAVDGVARAERWRASRSVRTTGSADTRRLGTRWAALTLAITFVLCGLRPFGDLVDPDAWRSSPRHEAARAAAEVIPDGASVAADNRVAPHLTARTRVLLFDQTPRGTDWVLADLAHRQFPFSSVEEQRAEVEDLYLRGYEPVFSRRGYLVLHKDGDGP